VVCEDVCPSILAQHEEHQDIDQPQEVNIDPADTFVSVVPLKNGFEADGHGSIPVSPDKPAEESGQ
jgi:hypothetical protein